MTESLTDPELTLQLFLVVSRSSHGGVRVRFVRNRTTVLTCQPARLTAERQSHHCGVVILVRKLGTGKALIANVIFRVRSPAP